VIFEDPQGSLFVLVRRTSADLTQKLPHRPPLPSGVNLTELRFATSEQGWCPPPEDAMGIAITKSFIRVGDTDSAAV
jgi:hypothetical protein